MTFTGIEVLTMEELIPYTSKVLKLYGIDLINDSKFTKYWVRSFAISVIIFNLLFTIYRLLTKADHIPVDFALLVFQSAMLINLWTILNTRRKMKRVFSVGARVLSTDEKEKIRKQDMIFVAFVLITKTVAISYMTYYSFHYGGQQAMTLVFGSKFSDSTLQDPILSLLVPFAVAGSLIMVSYLFSANWSCIIYYITVQYLLKQIASNYVLFIRNSQYTKQMLRKQIPVEVPSQDIFRKSLERFKFYDDMVETINDQLGIIPFSTLVDDFVSIMCCISFLVIYHSSFTFSFVVPTIGFMISLKLILLHFSIKVGCDSYDQMKKARNEAVNLLSDTSFHSRNESWSNLSLYLSKKSVSKSTVWNLFKMKRTIILSFAESVIPFTVMIVTTCMEFKSSHNNNV